MDPAAAAHRDVTRREFARQAAGFERRGSIFRAGDILEWIADHVPVRQSDVVLDVAGGTGQLGRHLRRSAAFTVVVDLTAEMLETGARAMRDDDERGVVFVEGDATRLPFAAEQFDVVVSRFALHHIDDVAAAAAEMARVCRPGGTVAVVDMACEPGEAGPSPQRARAPARSQPRARPGGGRAGGGAGRRRRARGGGGRTAPVDAGAPWIEQSAPREQERERVVAALEGEADGGASTGLRARHEEGGLAIEQRWLIVAGERA